MYEIPSKEIDSKSSITLYEKYEKYKVEYFQTVGVIGNTMTYKAIYAGSSPVCSVYGSIAQLVVALDC